MKHIVHVAQDAIRKNLKHGTNYPAIIHRTYKGAERVHRLNIRDAEGNVVATLIHDQENPLSCGARVWLETEFPPC